MIWLVAGWAITLALAQIVVWICANSELEPEGSGDCDRPKTTDIVKT